MRPSGMSQVISWTLRSSRHNPAGSPSMGSLPPDPGGPLMPHVDDLKDPIRRGLAPASHHGSTRSGQERCHRAGLWRNHVSVGDYLANGDVDRLSTLVATACVFSVFVTRFAGTHFPHSSRVHIVPFRRKSGSGSPVRQHHRCRTSSWSLMCSPDGAWTSMAFRSRPMKSRLIFLIAE